MSTGHLAHALKRAFGDLLDDARVSEIAVNPDGRVWVERAGDPGMTAATPLDRNDANDLANDLAGDRALSERTPLAGSDVVLGNALWRSQIVTPPAVEGGPAIALRRTVSEPRSLEILTRGANLRHLIEGEDEEEAGVFAALAGDDLALFLRRAVWARWNVVFSGGTSSGKTTWLRACVEAVPSTERLVTIEDVYELRPKQPNIVQLRTGDRIPAADLLRASLRLRPDRILMGELRGPEAFDFLSAINSGHPGGITTLHATSPEAALNRLALMVMDAGKGLGFGEVVAYCRAMIDVIVQLRLVEGERRVTAIEVFRKPPDAARGSTPARARREAKIEAI